MLVVRRTLQVRDQDAQKFVELVKSWSDLGFPSPPHGHRIYTFGKASPWGLVIWEQEFESLTEYEAHWKEGAAVPGFGEQLKRFMELVDSRGSTTEFWKVEHLD